MKIDFSKRIFLGLTGRKVEEFGEKLKELDKFRIKEAALFFEFFNKEERENLYRLLLKSSLRKAPLVHIREDMGKSELRFLMDNFKSDHFNIHENHFAFLNQWKGYWKNLYLEMNYDSQLAKDVKVRRIGGFCIDLAHFKAALARGAEEAYYIFSRRKKIKFGCNHLNGYSSQKNIDLHTITSLRDFDYLTTLPKYVFSNIIALEIFNPLKEQLKFRDYLIKLLNKYFQEK